MDKIFFWLIGFFTAKLIYDKDKRYKSIKEIKKGNKKVLVGIVTYCIVIACFVVAFIIYSLKKGHATDKYVLMIFTVLNVLFWMGIFIYLISILFFTKEKRQIDSGNWYDKEE